MIGKRGYKYYKLISCLFFVSIRRCRVSENFNFSLRDISTSPSVILHSLHSKEPSRERAL
jgi:hypothetical protein